VVGYPFEPWASQGTFIAARTREVAMKSRMLISAIAAAALLTVGGVTQAQDLRLSKVTTPKLRWANWLKRMAKATQ
jgi:hypothetical protein